MDVEALIREAHGISLIDPIRLRVLAQACLDTAGLPGDAAELGVYRGGSARLLAQCLPGRTLHLFDTFAGLPADDTPGGAHVRGEFACGLEEVRACLADCPHVAYHAGIFPASAEGLEGCRFALVHVDCDLEQSVADALAWFGSRMAEGGAMILDDYGWHKTPGVRRQVGRFRGYKSITTRSDARQCVLRF